MRKWRKATWAILVWTGLIVAWMISAGNEGNKAAADCANDQFLTKADCETAVNVGTGLGVMFIGLTGFVGFVALSLVWLMSRPREVIVVVQPPTADN